MIIPRLYWPYEGMGILDLNEALNHVFITQRFGENPQDYLQFGYPGHNGLDLVGKGTKNITPVGEGRVLKKAYEVGGYGNYVVVDHGWGQSYYGHGANDQVYVQPGNKVDQFSVLMKEGSTGNSTGSHLHLGIKIPGYGSSIYKGYVDPLPLLLEGDNPPEDPVETLEGYSGEFPVSAVTFAEPYLNIRLLPNYRSLDLGNLLPGSELEVTGIVEGDDRLVWAKTQIDVYVWSRYLKKEE